MVGLCDGVMVQREFGKNCNNICYRDVNKMQLFSFYYLYAFIQRDVMRTLALFRENLKIALNAIRTNLLRTILTVLIIAFGIMALVGILTAIDAIKGSLSEQFSVMGANSFSIESSGMQVNIGNESFRRKNHPYIGFREAREFKERFQFPAVVSIRIGGSGTAVVKNKSYQSNPNVQVQGGDENFLFTAGYDLASGRNLTPSDIEQNENVVILGDILADRAFGKGVDPINEFITIGGGRYRVIGVLKPRGNSFGFGSDNICLVPYTNVRQYFSRPQMSYSITVRVFDTKLLDIAASEAEGLFRIVRGLDVIDQSDFNIMKSDQFANMLLENLKYVTYAATIIGIITLLGAVVGLMNIMLVSVTERTREIGIRKALGAKPLMIRRQFLYEAVVIGQIGGVVGILLGILIGNAVSLSIGSAFLLPWKWMLLGVFLCFIVGVVSGYFPAVKGSRLDPIIALRHE